MATSKIKEDSGTFTLPEHSSTTTLPGHSDTSTLPGHSHKSNFPREEVSAGALECGVEIVTEDPGQKVVLESTILKFVQLGLKCCSANPSKRPNMYQVAVALEGLMEEGESAGDPQAPEKDVPFPEYVGPTEDEVTARVLLALGEVTFTRTLRTAQ